MVHLTHNVWMLYLFRRNDGPGRRSVASLLVRLVKLPIGFVSLHHPELMVVPQSPLDPSLCHYSLRQSTWRAPPGGLCTRHPRQRHPGSLAHLWDLCSRYGMVKPCLRWRCGRLC